MAQRIFNGTLVANQVTVITPDPSFRTAVIKNLDGAGPIYIRADGPDPVPPWDDCEVHPPAIGWITVRLHTDADGVADLRMRSPATPSYSVKFS